MRRLLIFHSNLILRVFVSNATIEEALLNSLLYSPLPFVLFYLWTEKSKSLKELTFTWQELKAQLPGHPEVETFLRSPFENFSYKIFSLLADARRFAQELHRTGPLKEFSVTMTTWHGSGKSCCIIVKNQSHYDSVTGGILTRKNELEVRSEKYQTVTPDEVCIVSTPTG